MQISTRTQDFLVDTLALRPHLHLLNSSFANPAIVKVLHGADSDVVWLQKDFGVYLVNLFDTGQAARILGGASFFLALLPCLASTQLLFLSFDFTQSPLDLASGTF